MRLAEHMRTTSEAKGLGPGRRDPRTTIHEARTTVSPTCRHAVIFKRPLEIAGAAETGDSILATHTSS
eukprot:scaffold218524_cov37-Tisochrysis_lutea.AAC.4